MKSSFKKRKKQAEGITLIALVITIIILLILAGISISALTGSGLFDKAKEAKQQSENAQEEENATLDEYVAKINEINGESSGGNQGSAESSTATTHTATEITYSWDDIANMAKAISNNNSINENTLEVKVTLNKETKILGVGDYKTLDGKKVRILGFNHDTLTTSTAYGTSTATGKAGISFEYVDFIDVSGTGAGTTTAEMNSPCTNSGGWEACELRSTLNGTVYNSLSIKDKIKQVTKDYIPTYDTATTTTCPDYLWLLSCGEIWDNGYGGDSTQNTRGYAIATEGKQYKYYKIGNPKWNSTSDYIKKPNPGWWWLRSPYYRDWQFYCAVRGSYCDASTANGTYGVAPGFSI